MAIVDFLCDVLAFLAYNLQRLKKILKLQKQKVLILVPLESAGGGGLCIAPPISEVTRPIFKIQTAFDSPAKVVEWSLILLTSGSPMTSQVRSKIKNIVGG